MEKVSSEQQLKGNVHYPVKGRRIGSLIYGLVGRYKWFNLVVPVQLLVSLLSLILILIAILAQDLLLFLFEPTLHSLVVLSGDSDLLGWV